MSTVNERPEQKGGPQSAHAENESSSIEFQESFSLTVAELFFPLFKRFLEDEAFIDDLEDDLGNANINFPVEIYVSAALGYGSIIGAVLGLLVGAVVWIALTAVLSLPHMPWNLIPFSELAVVRMFVNTLSLIRYPFLAAVAAGLGGGIGLFSALVLSVYYPKVVKRRRARQIDLMLGDALSFMYSLSVGGTNQIRMLESVANAEDAYGEVSVEFQRIVFEMKYFNTDYQTAVEKVSRLTPSRELTSFLTDMLSVVNSGGDMTSFLETQQEMMRERGRQKQEQMLDSLELFGEMYITVTVFPIGLLIVLVVIALIGSPNLAALYTTVYAVIPGINLIFAIIIATVKKDEIGSGILDTEGNVAAEGEDATRLRRVGIIDYYTKGDFGDFFKPIRTLEFRYRLSQVLRSPWEFFRLRPAYVLILTVPLTALVMLVLVGSGLASVVTHDMVVEPYIQTIMWLYVPVFLNVAPLAFFYEWNRRTRGRITDTLTNDLRKLANANETGQPLLEAMRLTAIGRKSILSDEFERMYKKSKFGTSLGSSLVEFNNRYRIPRLARTVKLVQKAQEASSNITEVLKTAATASRYQDDLEQDRLQRTRVQVAITAFTFLVFLGVVLMLEVFFIGELIRNVGSDIPLGGFEQIELGLISMLFFHAITIQALSAGAISGYVQTGRIDSSYKYIVAYMVIAAIAWGAFAG